MTRLHYFEETIASIFHSVVYGEQSSFFAFFLSRPLSFYLFLLFCLQVIDVIFIIFHDYPSTFWLKQRFYFHRNLTSFPVPVIILQFLQNIYLRHLSLLSKIRYCLCCNMIKNAHKKRIKILHQFSAAKKHLSNTLVRTYVLLGGTAHPKFFFGPQIIIPLSTSGLWEVSTRTCSVGGGVWTVDRG
jgi:hypothetical protein